MIINHDILVFISKSFGLIYLMLFSLAVLVYVFWPSNKRKFDTAALSVIDEKEDRPWQ